MNMGTLKNGKRHEVSAEVSGNRGFVREQNAEVIHTATTIYERVIHCDQMSSCDLDDHSVYQIALPMLVLILILTSPHVDYGSC